MLHNHLARAHHLLMRRLKRGRSRLGDYVCHIDELVPERRLQPETKATPGAFRERKREKSLRRRGVERPLAFNKQAQPHQEQTQEEQKGKVALAVNLFRREVLPEPAQASQVVKHLAQGRAREQPAVYQGQTIARACYQRPVEIERALQRVHALARLLIRRDYWLLVKPPFLFCQFHNCLRHNEHAIVDAAGIVPAHKIRLLAPEEQTEQQQVMESQFKGPMGMRSGVERRAGLGVGVPQQRGRWGVRDQAILMGGRMGGERRVGEAEVESQVAAICTSAAGHQFTQHAGLWLVQRVQERAAGPLFKEALSDLLQIERGDLSLTLLPAREGRDLAIL